MSHIKNCLNCNGTVSEINPGEFKCSRCGSIFIDRELSDEEGDGFDDEDDVIGDNPKLAFSEIIKKEPVYFSDIEKYKYTLDIKHGDMIFTVWNGEDVLPLLGIDKFKTVKSVFNGFDFGKNDTIVYESEKDIEDYLNINSFLYIKENTKLLDFSNQYYCNDSSTFNKLAQALNRDKSKTPRENIAGKFYDLISQKTENIVNIFVICATPDKIMYYKYLGHYKIDKVESLANGAIVWRRDSEKLN